MTPARAMSTDALEDTYYQQAYESLQRHNRSTTYPGPIRAATPGNANNWHPHGESHAFEVTNDPMARSYWRPVADDPEIRELVQVRIRHKESVFVGSKWATHQHVAIVSVAPDATIDEILAEAHANNESAYVGTRPGSYTLAFQGRSVDGEDRLDSLVSDKLRLAEKGVTFDAIDVKKDHLWHTEDARPQDWLTYDVEGAGNTTDPLVADFAGVATHRNLADTKNTRTAEEEVAAASKDEKPRTKRPVAAVPGEGFNDIGQPDIDAGHLR